ncbi:NAD-dependent epimerase/dehydratase family protein [Pseudacidobacterium ailaaui]|uniref:NAD-dependent epimerase/dehydratase family protein n=1 Tax=Pseudacidobacterium ailaaui TaxID=1382359 RepID=UPI00047DADC8|nr:SDR family oxidoreductase [Pseudacidobacterium ailaaui]
MKVAFLGHTGLIGAAVYHRIVHEHPVLTCGRGNAHDRHVDLSDPDSIAALDLDGSSTLVHCSGIVDEDFLDAGRAFRQATQGMAALVKKAKSAGVKRFAYVSSAHIYGPFYGTINETTPPNPLHDYAIAHFASEQILRRAASSDFCVLVLRPCAVFGIPPDTSRFRRWALIPFGFPREAVVKGTITLASRGLQRRNFVGAQDIASVVHGWLHQHEDPLPFSAVNPIGKDSMSVLAFAELCAQVAERVTGRPCRVIRPDGPDPDPDSFEYTSIYPQDFAKADLAKTLEQWIRILHAATISQAQKERT